LREATRRSGREAGGKNPGGKNSVRQFHGEPLRRKGRQGPQGLLMNPSPNFTVTALLTLLLTLAGCTVGPNFKRPSAARPPAFKEQPPVNFKEAEAAGWKQSQP